MKLFGFLVVSALLAAFPVVVQSQESAGGDWDGLAPITRNLTGSTVLRAFRLDGPIEVDGQLDEVLYQTVPPITGFIQAVPDEGAPATEKTDVWILFDDVNVYVLARCWDSAPESQWIANEMRRDGTQLRQNDTFSVTFDTFFDRRNGSLFYTNPLGAQADVAISNERSITTDWNPLWTVRTGRFEGGWSVEMAIPFKSLRYRDGRQQTWGVQLRRSIRRKNEWVYITSLPRSVVGTGSTGVVRVSLNATLEGLEAPPPSRLLEIKPYAISGLRTESTEAGGLSNDLYGDAGLDVKVGITPGLTADLTFNTDFAQVEVDEEQVNLTRFSLRFPEKREFFLEGSGIFGLSGGSSGGGRGGGGGGGGGGGMGGMGGGGDAPDLFFSRRIGLEGGDPVPIIAGGRLTGKLGAFDVGALSVQTDADDALAVPSTNFSVLRLRRDVLARSNVGALFARRSKSTVAEGSNETYGLDATLAFSAETSLIGYYAETRTQGFDGGEESYQGQFSYQGDPWELSLDHLLVGENFNPEVGFLRRRDGFRQTQFQGSFSPRPTSIPSIRQLTFQTGFDYTTDEKTSRVEERGLSGQFRIEFENSDLFMLSVSDTHELLQDPFDITSEVSVPAGGYDYRDVMALYSFGSQRRSSGRVSVRTGSFYDGNRTTLSLSQGRIEILPQLSVEPSVTANWVDLPEGSFNANVLSTRISYSFSPQTFLSGLVQYNSSNRVFSTNLRLRWEFAPGSELFVVYTDERNTDIFDRFPELLNRGLVVKINRLFRP